MSNPQLAQCFGSVGRTVTYITTEQLGAVRRLTLNRPDKRNALSPQFLDELCSAVEQATDDSDSSVILLQGKGKGFSAGFELGGSPSSNIWTDRERLRRTSRKLEALWECPLPTVVAVHGFALAGGADLALHCDLLVMADDARIGYPPVRNLGVPPTNMWLYRLGPQMTKRMLFTGDSLTGEEAAQIGLAIQSCPAARLADVALRLAQRIALVSRECLIGNKAVVNRGIDLMGRPHLSRFAEVEDAIGHVSPAAQAFRHKVAQTGLGEALHERDAPFSPDPPGIVATREPPSRRPAT